MLSSTMPKLSAKVSAWVPLENPGAKTKVSKWNNTTTESEYLPSGPAK